MYDENVWARVHAYTYDWIFSDFRFRPDRRFVVVIVAAREVRPKTKRIPEWRPFIYLGVREVEITRRNVWPRRRIHKYCINIIITTFFSIGQRFETFRNSSTYSTVTITITNICRTREVIGTSVLVARADVCNVSKYGRDNALFWN